MSMWDKSILLKKAKALAALEAGNLPIPLDFGLYGIRRPYNGQANMPEPQRTPIDALAAAADALGLKPDPAVLVELTEEEKEVLDKALVSFQTDAEINAMSTLLPPETRARYERLAEIARNLRERFAGS